MNGGSTNVLGLCSGGLGLERAIGSVWRDSRTICYVEREAFAVANMVAAMDQGALDPAPIWTDLRSFDGRPWRGIVDIVAAGYPCQPFSVAGRGLGAADPRHLWPEVRRIVSECEPEYVVCENVPPHVRRGFDQVAGELHDLGYRVALSLRRAEEVGAPHRRERMFFVAHSLRVQQWNESGRAGRASGQGAPRSGDDGATRHLADADGASSARHARGTVAQDSEPGGGRSDARRHWTVEPGVGRVAHGVAARVDRLRMLGNGVVPAQAALAIRDCLAALTDNP